MIHAMDAWLELHVPTQIHDPGAPHGNIHSIVWRAWGTSALECLYQCALELPYLDHIVVENVSREDELVVVKGSGRVVRISHVTTEEARNGLKADKDPLPYSPFWYEDEFADARRLF